MDGSGTLLSLKDLPLHGKRVDIRLFTEQDLTNQYIDWLNDPVVVRYSNQRFRLNDHATCAAYLASFQDSDNLFLSVRSKEDDEAIGTMTVYFSRHHGTADIGILIGDTNSWGHGYGQDAWNTVVDWLCTQPCVRKVTAGTTSCNSGMLKVLERSGMEKEAVRRRQEIVDGKAVDIHYYARYREA